MVSTWITHHAVVVLTAIMSTCEAWECQSHQDCGGLDSRYCFDCRLCWDLINGNGGQCIHGGCGCGPDCPYQSGVGNCGPANNCALDADSISGHCPSWYARYIKISQKSTLAPWNTWDAYEFDLYDNGAVLSYSIHANSGYANAAGHINHINDNNANTYWANDYTSSSTDCRVERRQWVVLDLGSIRYTGGIRIKQHDSDNRWSITQVYVGQSNSPSGPWLSESSHNINTYGWTLIYPPGHFCLTPNTQGYIVDEEYLWSHSLHVGATCAAGYYGSASVSQCTSAGSAYGLSGCSACTASCPAGSYPGSCPAGTANDPGCLQCTGLPLSASFISANSCDWSCNAGYYRPSPSYGSCLSCTSACGVGQLPGTCAAGSTFNPGCSTCSSAPANAEYISSGSCDWQCSSGHYKSGQSCVACSSGCGVGQTNPSCPAGSTSNPGCQQCNKPSDSYFTALNSCAWACNANHYRASDGLSCLDCTSSCEIGNFAGSCPAGSTSDPGCQQCVTAPANARYTTDQCGWECNGGFYATRVEEGWGFTIWRSVCSPCTTGCAVGQVAPVCAAGAHSADPGCTTCNSRPSFAEYTTAGTCAWHCTAGYYLSEGECNLCTTHCAAGSTPSSCPAGSTADPGCSQCPTSSPDGSEYTQANACSWQCLAGLYRSGAACVACTTTCGTGSTPAAICPTGSTADPGCRQCTNKPVDADYTAVDACDWHCSAGHYLSDDGNSCPACTVSCGLGETPDDCPAGSTTDPGCTQCTDAPIHAEYTFANTCDWHCSQGFSLNGGQCTPCPADCTVGETPPACPAGTQGSMECVACTAPNSFSEFTTANSCDWQCTGGYYLSGGSGCLQCTTECDIGHTPPECPAGATVDPGCTLCELPANAVFTTAGTCGFDCTQGYYNDAGICIECLNTCLVGQELSLCPLGSIADAQCTTCTSKPINSAYTTNGTCEYDCLVGYWRDGDVCQQCETSCAAGSVPPVCPAGSQSDTGCEQCTAKPPNSAYTTPNTCGWECVDRFFLQGDACSPCTHTCAVGQRPPVCSAGSTLDPGCSACTNKPAFSDYVNINSCLYHCHEGFWHDDQSATCEVCTTNADCGPGEFAPACAAGARIDDPGCDQCAALVPTNSHYTSNCEWACDEGRFQSAGAIVAGELTYVCHACHACAPTEVTTAVCGETTPTMCECAQGYSGVPSTYLASGSCLDIDECYSDSTNNCNPDATCFNTAGSFTCTCNTGYSGDGVNCTNVDECLHNTHTCAANATCVDVIGHYECECNPGFAGDGETCVGCVDGLSFSLGNVSACSGCSVCDTPSEVQIVACVPTIDRVCECGDGFTDLDDTGSCRNCVAGRFGDTCATCPDCYPGICHDGYTGSGDCACPAGFITDIPACNQCLEGHYGPSCDPCPGSGGGQAESAASGPSRRKGRGRSNVGDAVEANEAKDNSNDDAANSTQEAYVCSGHGSCDDGFTGTGECTCEGWYNGAECNGLSATPSRSSSQSATQSSSVTTSQTATESSTSSQTATASATSSQTASLSASQTASSSSSASQTASSSATLSDRLLESSTNTDAGTLVGVAAGTAGFMAIAGVAATSMRKKKRKRMDNARMSMAYGNVVNSDDEDMMQLYENQLFQQKSKDLQSRVQALEGEMQAEYPGMHLNVTVTLDSAEGAAGVAGAGAESGLPSDRKRTKTMTLHDMAGVKQAARDSKPLVRIAPLAHDTDEAVVMNPLRHVHDRKMESKIDNLETRALGSNDAYEAHGGRASSIQVEDVPAGVTTNNSTFDVLQDDNL